MSAAGVERTADSPEIPEGFTGVRLAAGAGGHVHGVFQLPRAAAERLGPHRHRALVLVANRGTQHHASTPFQDRILFEDDETTGPDGARGYFHFDLSLLLGDGHRGDHWVLVSLGSHVSNVVRVRLG